MGIKSFQGARKAQKNVVDTTPIRVKDYMTTKLITFRPEQSVEEVIQSLIKNRISVVYSWVSLFNEYIIEYKNKSNTVHLYK